MAFSKGISGCFTLGLDASDLLVSNRVAFVFLSVQAEVTLLKWSLSGGTLVDPAENVTFNLLLTYGHL